MERPAEGRSNLAEAGLRVQGIESPAPRDVFLSKPVRALALALALVASVEFVPSLAAYRVLRAPPASEDAFDAPLAPEGLVGEATLTELTETHGTPAGPTRGARPSLFGGSTSEPRAVEPAVRPGAQTFLVRNGAALDGFFARLRATELGTRRDPTRILHFGDSVVVSDYVSGTLRRKFQSEFGDAGHGYVLIANAWPAYFHNDVFRFATSGFQVSRIVGPYAKDGLYGLGGVSFRATRGSVAQFGTAEKGDFGRAVSRFVIDHLAHPEGGTIELFVDGALRYELDTLANVPETRHAVLDVPDGEHRLEIRIRSGVARLFGVALERARPGIVYDALGVQGARIRFLDKQDDAHFARELALRDPALVVFQFGANESGDGYAYSMKDYQATMQEVLRQTKAAVPAASCLVIGAMDRARVEHGAVTSMKILQLITVEQERAAREVGCAYFDTYRAMGGFGSMPRWVKRGLGQADMTHPTYEGAERIANWIHAELIAAYRASHATQDR